MAILEVQHITKSFDGNQILKDISFTVERGDVIAIIGPSGAGKSTMLRCLIDLEKVNGGTILVDGHPLVQNGVYPRAELIARCTAKMGMVFQHFYLFPHMTVKKNLELAPLVVAKRTKEEAAADSAKYLEKVGMNEKADAYPRQLSGGQQQRVAIARALASEAKVLLADEPTGNLDEDTAGEIIELIKKTAHELGKCVIVVTHSKQLAEEADVILEISQGKLNNRESPKEDDIDEQLRKTFHTVAATIDVPDSEKLKKRIDEEIRQRYIQ